MRGNELNGVMDTAIRLHKMAFEGLDRRDLRTFINLSEESNKALTLLALNVSDTPSVHSVVLRTQREMRALQEDALTLAVQLLPSGGEA